MTCLDSTYQPSSPPTLRRIPFHPSLWEGVDGEMERQGVRRWEWRGVCSSRAGIKGANWRNDREKKKWKWKWKTEEVNKRPFGANQNVASYEWQTAGALFQKWLPAMTLSRGQTSRLICVKSEVCKSLLLLCTVGQSGKLGKTDSKQRGQAAATSCPLKKPQKKVEEKYWKWLQAKLMLKALSAVSVHLDLTAE